MRSKKRKAVSYLFPAALTAAILCAVFFLYGLFPFGDKTAAWGDMKQQVIPLLLDLKDILEGRSGFFLNLKNAGAMSFFGVFFFFLSSPFSFLVLLLEKTGIYHWINLLIMGKLILAAVSAAFFFDKVRPKLSLSLHTVCSIGYAFCGYGLLYYQNIGWLDLMILFPLMVLSFLRLIHRGASGAFCFCLTLCVILNYYLSYMVFLFLIFFSFFYLHFAVPKKKRGETAWKVGRSAVMALGFSAPVWIPSLLQCLASARVESIIESIREGSFFPQLSTTLPMLTCSSFLLLIPFFQRMVPPNGEDRAILSGFYLLLIPLIADPINKLWHTGNYQAFPVRYGYLFVFLGFWYLSGVLEREERPQNSRSKGGWKWSVCAVSFMALIALLSLKFLEGKGFDYTKTLWMSAGDFSVILAVSCACCVFISWGYMLWRKGKVLKSVFGRILLILCIIQSCFLESLFLGTAAGGFQREKRLLSLAALQSDTGLYRVKPDSKICDANLLGAAGWNTLAHYTSLTDEQFLKVMKQLGYSSYWMEVTACGGTVVSDYLLSNKYLLTKDFKLENTGAVDLGLIVSGADFSDLPEYGERLETQEKIFQDITGISGFCRYSSQKTERLEISKDGETWKLSPEKEGGKLTFLVSVKDKELLYFDAFHLISANLREKINDSFRITVNGEVKWSSYPTQQNNGILCLGAFQNETVRVEVEVLQQVELSSFGIFGFPVNRLSRLQNSISSGQFRQVGETVCGTATKNKEEESLLFTFPYAKGMKVLVNGKEREPRLIWDCFFSVPLDLGENQIKLTYLPNGIIEGGVCFFLTVFLSLLAFFFRKTSLFQLMRLWVEKVSYPALKTLFALVLILVYGGSILLWLF